MTTTTTTTSVTSRLKHLKGLPPIPSLSAFSLSPAYGFLPLSPPLKTLPPQFQAWDDLAASLPRILTSSNNPAEIRQKVDQLPVLSAADLTSPAQLHRAFVVLGFLIHGYMWADCDHPEPVIPPSLAAPYLKVCERLGMQPTLSYAGLCLWNWELKAEKEGFKKLENLNSLVTFTGTRDEETFYLVPVMVEAEGSTLVTSLTNALGLALQKERMGMEEEIAAILEHTGDTLKKMSGLISLLHQYCQPQVLYYRIRPYLRGAKGLEADGFPRGCIFQTSQDTEICVKCVGGSAAQSGLFHFIDLALGVVHNPVGNADGETVFEEMRSYMPKEHRDFLQAISELPSLRSFIETRSSNERLLSAYNGCITELAAWRSKHIGVVTTHIVNPARKAQVPSERQSVDEVKDGLSTADESMLQGTGGSALIPFWKHAKKETIDSRI